jgi:2-oxoisovalerate dehydrogenase E2 component (dihydrolipoyl transacylase)
MGPASIAGLNRAIADVAARARAGKLRLDDFGGGTFTIDNTGWLGSNLTMPIINVPEVAILTMEAITKRAVVVETPAGDSIAIRPVMNMVLGIDHRANDGAGGAAFLRTVKAWLEAVVTRDRDLLTRRRSIGASADASSSPVAPGSPVRLSSAGSVPGTTR